MWFFRSVSWMSASACGSIHVVTNDARLSVSRPSSIRPVCSSSYASSGSMPCSGNTNGLTRCWNAGSAGGVEKGNGLAAESVITVLDRLSVPTAA